MTNVCRCGLAALAIFTCVTAARAQLPQAKLFAVFPRCRPGSRLTSPPPPGKTLTISRSCTSRTPASPPSRRRRTSAASSNRGQHVCRHRGGRCSAGVYEVAAEGRFGATNTRRFVVARPEVNEVEGNVPATPTPIELETVVNAAWTAGPTSTGTADARRRPAGRHRCAAASIDSVSPVLEVYDAEGRRRLPAPAACTGRMPCWSSTPRPTGSTSSSCTTRPSATAPISSTA